MIDNTKLFAQNLLKLSPNDRVYSIPKMFFGYGLGNSLFFPLLTGATALLDDTWPSVTEIIKNINKFQPTAFFAVPNLYSSILAQKVEPANFSSIRLFFSAGAPLPLSLYEGWEARFGSLILDGIGATEVVHVFLTNTPEYSTGGSTGRPVPGYQVRLVDESFHDVTTGEQGVMLIRGPSVSPGYWENHSINLSKFRDGWYRTGDVFIEHESGWYAYKGREDDLFKVKGRWVIPTEIEALVQNKFPTIKEAVLIGIPDIDGLAKPTMFICFHSDETNKHTLINKLTNFISSEIDSHCLPHKYIVVDEMPRNDNGKLLRRELLSFNTNPIEEFGIVSA